MTHPSPRRLHGVVYPDPPPPADGPPTSPEDPGDELAMALHHVRAAFDPPLPDAFAHWLVQLHALVRDGKAGDSWAPIPDEILNLGYSFRYATGWIRDAAPTAAKVHVIELRDALRAFGRYDLEGDEDL